MTDAYVGVRPKIEVGGTALAQDLEILLEQTVVDDHLHLPDMFLLSFRDVGRDVLKRGRFQVGTPVKITVPPAGAGQGDVLVEGEVTALEAEYDALGSRALVRGYDGSHRLHRGRTTETYRNVKDSDIARTVAQRVGLGTGTIDDSRTTHEHVSQVNLSNWDFLTARASEIGFEVAVTEGKLDFRQPTPSSQAPTEGDLNSSTPLQLVFGRDLLEFRPRVSSAEQVKQVNVRGWDADRKEALVGSAPAATASADLPTNPAGLAHVFGDPIYSSVDRPYSSQAEVDTAAKAIADQIGSAAAEAEGVARGNPKLCAGAAVSVGVVADDFAGRYTLTHSRHIFDAHGYRTWFEVSGRQDRSLNGLVAGAATGASSIGVIPGVVVGLVTNNADPDGMGRVKLKFPWLSDSYESDWARMTQLAAGPDSGACFLPEVNDEVLVAFEFGDVRRPVVVGGLHNGKDKPRLGDGLFDNGSVKRRGLVSRRGHRVVLFDDPGKSGIALITSGGSIRVSLNETTNQIHLYCQGKIVLEAQGDLTLSSQQNITLQAQSQLKLSGQAGASLNSSAEVEVKGGVVRIN
ncbi:MAG TPA: VgrG-related protein [Candidatus Dormibacteraeota bacterium]|jgi:phage protein D|nr:VgrG-related protein [Candidatus Dormibacteraeota bacterium]